MFKGAISLLFAAGLVIGVSALSVAQEEAEGQSAMEQLEEAAQDGQEATLKAVRNVCCTFAM
jgi:hypothetical protein